jgi:hypothetical protein
MFETLETETILLITMTTFLSHKVGLYKPMDQICDGYLNKPQYHVIE